MKYEIVIYWSAEDEAFIAEVPELPGCMAGAPTKAKALAAIERVTRVPKKTSSFYYYCDWHALHYVN